MNPPPSLKTALCASPLLYPLEMDARGATVQFTRMYETDYAAASFLDQRLLVAGQPVAALAWADVYGAAKDLPTQCDFIFHISHVGSTLLSRLLGQHPAVLSLREPAILRRLAVGEFPDRWDIFLGLWSRTFHAQQKSIIKATSFVSAIADKLLEQVKDSRAVLMYVPACTFIAAMLDGVMSDIDSSAAPRLARLQQFGWLPPVQLQHLSAGERVAMSWLAEMLSLHNTAERFPERILWIDFDAFLENVEEQLTGVLQHFHINGNALSLLAGNTMNQYAKRPDVPYNKQFRQQLLARANANHTAEIALGLAWLERVLLDAPSRPANSLQRLLSGG